MFKTKTILIAIFTIGLAALAGDYSANKENVAIGGYDVVAYHTRAEAVRGSAEHSVVHGGTTFYFSNAANQQMFKASPQKYLPQFGGYCAFAVAMKKAKVPADPQTFKLRDGKLYLFFNDFYQGKPFNTMIPWNQNEKEMLGHAEENWKAM